MTCYRVFPGINLIFNSFYAADGIAHGKEQRDFLELNHCRMGRFECEFEDGFRAYLGEGDFAVSTMETRQVASSFPLSRYYGLSLVAEVGPAQEYLSARWPELEIDLPAVKEKFCGQHCFFGRPSGEIRQFFDGLYREFPAEIRSQMYQIKTLELFQLLKITPGRERGPETVYISREKSEQMKQIRRRLEAELSCSRSCFASGV